jgi:bifunctional NMN adenylyltransferase/nudix hydrolase
MAMLRSNVGVAVMRCQVSSLTVGHEELIKYMMAENDGVIVVLGESPVRPNHTDPLSIEMRRNMIKYRFPKVVVLSIMDRRDDVEWSKELDRMIAKNIPPGSKVKLYGGRDSFLPHYFGKYQVEEFSQQMNSQSGTSQRKQVACNPDDGSENFRRGAIWATQNQYVRVVPTVDIAPIIYHEGAATLVMIKKDSDNGKIRFIGGHIEPDRKGQYKNKFAEVQAAKECKEEADLEAKDDTIRYLGSFFVNDWRYKSDMVMTMFFVADAIGEPRAGDDADDIILIPVREMEKYRYIVVEEHLMMYYELARHFEE